MFRTSSFLAILVSATAIGSATVPAAAGPLQVFGGGSHLAQLPSKAPALTRPLPIQIPHPAPAAGIAKVGNAELPIPVSHGGTSVRNAELPKQDLPPVDNCATHPYLPMCRSPGSGSSSSTYGGGSGSGSASGSGSGSGGAGSGSAGGSGSTGGSGKSGGSGPVVIVVPPVRVPIAVPVGIPAPIPYGAQPRIAAGGGSASAATAQAQPVITPQCMTAADNPPLASMIDQLLPTAPLSDAARAQVTELRQTIQVLETGGKDAAARDTEEVAMNLLGYQKVWLRCRTGTFMWQKQATSADAGQQK